MYKNTAKFDDDYLAKAQSVPANTSAYGNGGSFKLDNGLGSVAIVGEIDTACTLSSLSHLNVDLYESADDNSFTLATSLCSITGTDAAWPAGTKLFEHVPKSDVKPHVKVKITTNDAGATGKIDVFQSYNPR